MMTIKKFLTLLLTFCIYTCFAQNTAEFTLMTSSGPASGIIIKLVNTKTKETLSEKTNGAGKVKFIIQGKGEWEVYTGPIKQKENLETEEGTSESASSLWYDPELNKRLEEQTIDRKGFAIKTSGNEPGRRPQNNESTIIVMLTDDQKMPVGNTEVNVVCVADQIIYQARTDMRGKASFLVPAGKNYDIDVADVMNMSYMDIGSKGNQAYTTDITYQAANIPERVKGDSIFQDASKADHPFSNRAFYRIKINTVRQDLLGGSNIYLEEIGGKRIYISKTDANGEAKFLLPMGKKYMIQMDYMKDIDVANLAHQTGLAKGYIEVTYIPNPKLEHPEQFIPKPAEVFVKEFDQFIKKQYPQPLKELVGIYLKWGNGEVGEKSKEALLEVGFSCSRNTEKYSSGPKLNICLVLDKSGSMEGSERIGKLKEAVKVFIQSLRPTDILSIVLFEHKQSVLRQPAVIGSGVAEILDQVSKIEAGGGTNIYNGLKEGYELVSKNFNKQNINRVILLTDGYGADDVSTTINMSKTYNTKGIDLSAVGVGDGYNYALLQQLASYGGGLLQFADDHANFTQIFLNEISGLLHPIARQASVEIEYNDQIVFKQIYGFTFKKVDATKVSLSLMNLFPGLNKMALVKFDLTKPTQEIEKKPVIVRMQYTNLENNQVVKLEEKAYLKWKPYVGWELVYEEEQKKLYCIAVMNQSIKNMAEQFAAGNKKGALAQVKRTLEEVNRLYPKANDADVQALVSELRNYTEALAIAAKKP